MSPCFAQSRTTPASNDNGPLSAPRGGARTPLSNIVRVAAEFVGAITLSYVAGGVMMITRTAA